MPNDEVLNSENKVVEKNKGGRPKGSTTKPRLSDYMSEAEREKYVRHYMARAKKSDKVLTHLVDQLLGKANQSVDVRGEILAKLIKLD